MNYPSKSWQQYFFILLALLVIVSECYILSLTSYADDQVRIESEINMENKEINQRIEEYYNAMVTGDMHLLAAILDDNFSLTHITGYVQPKNEWLTQMEDGQFIYYNIDVQSTEIKVKQNQLKIESQTITDATVYGIHNKWHLQLVTEMEKNNNQWVIIRTIATTW